MHLAGRCAPADRQHTLRESRGCRSAVRHPSTGVAAAGLSSKTSTLEDSVCTVEGIHGVVDLVVALQLITEVLDGDPGAGMP